MNTNLWAIGAIIVIATVYELNPKIGVGLTVIVLMAMVYTYFSKNPVSYEVTL